MYDLKHIEKEIRKRSNELLMLFRETLELNHFPLPTQKQNLIESAALLLAASCLFTITGKSMGIPNSELEKIFKKVLSDTEHIKYEDYENGKT